MATTPAVPASTVAGQAARELDHHAAHIRSVFGPRSDFRISRRMRGRSREAEYSDSPSDRSPLRWRTPTWRLDRRSGA